MVCRRGFALSFFHIGNSAGLSYCTIVSALFFLGSLRLFRLVLCRRFCGGVGIRCFLRLRFQIPVRVPALSPAWSPARRPTSASGAKLPPSAVHAPALRSHISALEVSAGSALECGASAASGAALHHHVPASKAPAVCAWTPTLEALTESTRSSALPTRTRSAGSSALPARTVPTAASTLPTLEILIQTLAKRTIRSSWPLEALTVSTGTSALPARPVSAGASVLPTRVESAGSSALPAPAESTWPSALPARPVSTGNSTLWALDILIWILGKGAKWSWSPGIIRLHGIRVCVHLWSAGHHASPSRPVASTLTATPSRPGACRPGKRLTGQNRQCQPGNNRCYGFCLFHFQFLSLIFRSTAFLIPVFGSFYRDSGAGGKKVTPVTHTFLEKPRSLDDRNSLPISNRMCIVFLNW